MLVEDFVKSFESVGRYVRQHTYLQIDEVKEKACSDGLLEEEIDKLINIMVSRKLPNRCFLALLRCLIPKTTVSKKSVKLMISWVTSNFFHSTDQLIISVLQWICCLLEFEVTEKQAVNDFYTVFFFFLSKSKLIPFSCRLIHFLTKPDDVTRWTVSHILATEKKTNGLKQPALAVLNLFKSFKPECVPEDIPPVSVSVVFRPLPEVTRMYFSRAQRRNEAQRTPKGKELYWRTISSTYRRKRKYGQELIPPVDYIKIGPSMFEDKSACSVLKFSSFSELCSYQLSVAIPSSILSLLANHAGRHIIAYGDVQVQSRFSYLLFNKLYDVLILKEPFPREEVEKCLSSLVELEEYMQQGVPIVSKMLSEFIIMWDGYEFQDHILRLLEWVTTSSYEDLYDCVLHHLRNSFVSLDSTQRCAVIRMFRRLVTNMYISTLYRNEESLDKPFLTYHQEWGVAATLEKTVMFVHEELVMLGLSQHYDDDIFLEEVVSFCETVLYLQEDSKFPLYVMIPPVVVSHCVFGRHYFLVTRVHTLLKRYVMMLELRGKGVDGKKWQKEREMLQRSCREFNSALFGQVEFAASTIDTVASYELYENLNKLFRLNHHLAFSSHISMFSEAGVLLNRKGQKHFSMNAVKNVFEDVKEIKECNG